MVSLGSDSGTEAINHEQIEEKTTEPPKQESKSMTELVYMENARVPVSDICNMSA